MMMMALKVAAWKNSSQLKKELLEVVVVKAVIAIAMSRMVLMTGNSFSLNCHSVSHSILLDGNVAFTY